MSVPLSLGSRSGSDRAMRQIDARLHQLSVLYSLFRVKKRNAPEPIRSLPASTVEALYQLLDPESGNNPFPRIRTRWRIYIAFILMLHQGLRRGEVSLLPGDAVRSGYDARLGRNRSWINIRENDYEDSDQDPRHSKPSIKTQASVRQIPISETTARIVQLYAASPTVLASRCRWLSCDAIWTLPQFIHGRSLSEAP